MKSILRKSFLLTGLLTAALMAFAERPILYIYKHEGVTAQDGVYQYLLSQGKTIDARPASSTGLRSAEEYAQYEWVLMSEDADADNAEVLAITRDGANLPVLNMKSFSYTPERLNWGQPNNGSLSENGRFITVERDDHPIFQALGKQKGDKIQILESIDFKGLMPIDVNLPGTLCLATALTRNIDEYEADGEPQTFLHEVPANIRGGKKYICLPIAMSSSTRLTDEGKALMDAIIDYLLSAEPTVTRPTLQITHFSIEGQTATINQMDNTISLEIDLGEFPDIDPTAVLPEVETASSYSHIVPLHGEPVDLSQSAEVPVAFVVSDYINRRSYDVRVTFHNPLGIENIYQAGEWVNIYDIFGRKIVGTNEDIYRTALPHGVYIVTTDSGATFKILR